MYVARYVARAEMERSEEIGGGVVVEVEVIVVVGAEDLFSSFPLLSHSPSSNSFPLSNCYYHLTKHKPQTRLKIRSHTAATRYRQGQMGKSE